MSKAARINIAGPSDVKRPQEVARYIGEICLELRNLAASADLDLLVHILDMAVEEADEQQQACIPRRA